MAGDRGEVLDSLCQELAKGVVGSNSSHWNDLTTMSRVCIDLFKI